MISQKDGRFNLKSHMNAKLRSFILKCLDLLTCYASEQKVIVFNFYGLYALIERYNYIDAGKFCLCRT